MAQSVAQVVETCRLWLSLVYTYALNTADLVYTYTLNMGVSENYPILGSL